ncbi:hypothetical protein GCM10023228_26260 [Brevibacillus fulvus]
MLFPNLPIKTAGGKVFWDTLDRRNGWKLQQNRLTGHFRILDPDDVRQACVGNGRGRDVAHVPQLRRVKERVKASRWLTIAFGIFESQEVFDNGRDSAIRTVPCGEWDRAENDSILRR